jgi:hypothetical protein
MIKLEKKYYLYIDKINQQLIITKFKNDNLKLYSENKYLTCAISDSNKINFYWSSNRQTIIKMSGKILDNYNQGEKFHKHLSKSNR